VGCGGGEVWVTLATEDTKVRVGWVGSIKGKVGGVVIKSFGGMSVDETRGSVESFNPEGSGEVGLKEHIANNVLRERRMRSALPF
jgi:hypothetical protein